VRARSHIVADAVRRCRL